MKSKCSLKKKVFYRLYLKCAFGKNKEFYGCPFLLFNFEQKIKFLIYSFCVKLVSSIPFHALSFCFYVFSLLGLHTCIYTNIVTLINDRN